MKALPKEFYIRDPETVARDLLGKRLVRRLGSEELIGIIVETEAYYGADDPASRASKGIKPHNKLMFEEPGRAFIYNVHNNWMFNIVAHEEGKVGAVLIRAIQPVKGIDIMKKNRKVHEISKLTNGPGKLTKALKIDKSLNGASVTSTSSEIYIANGDLKFNIESSHRIGVKADLKRELRFFIKDNPFVSR
ncbi:DNA-3-methyladenine glycosylase [Candidatus Bathyarchaeota archaeon]|nr:MAG: DNA-3-methyladenine glycosylase [Candidatus Bathyarchaeota archaeon]